MKKIAIAQSNYIPWKGYFDTIAYVDEFILYDCVQYTRRDWRNRNKIYTKEGIKWLSIPVEVKGKYHQKINETLISDNKWGPKHWCTIENSYGKSAYFKKYKDVFCDYYLNNLETNLSKINFDLIKIINNILGINTKISFSTDYEKLETNKTERLLSICKNAGGDVYVSGPAAQSYFDLNVARNYNIAIEWANFSNYAEYTQLHKPFENSVTILDMIFNLGPNARNYLKH
jgi:hypothetical protein